MERAVSNYALYRTGVYACALGRFILPVSRLEEFESTLAKLPPGAAGPSPWALSVLAGTDLECDLRTVGEFNQRHAARAYALIDSVELKTSEVTAILGASRMFQGFLLFCEIPGSADPAPLVAALRQAGARAKLRTGGLTPDSIIPASAVERFMRTCCAERVPFKATAGLHHALRSVYRLTYDDDSPSGLMHGFLNVFLAAAFIRSGLGSVEALELLEERRADAFRFEADGVAWGSHRIGSDELVRARSECAVSFGSCSFLEPLEDMERMSLTPVAARSSPATGVSFC